MVEITRETIAYSLIGIILLVGLPAMVVAFRKRRRHRLRQRGIKRYGH